MKKIIQFLSEINNKFNQLPTMTPKHFLDAIFVFCIMAFITSCSSNAEGYASAEQAQDTARTTSIPYDSYTASTVGTSFENREITPDGADTTALKYKVKSTSIIVNETVDNAQQALIDAKKRVQELEVLQKSKSSVIVDLDPTDTTVKPKSPAAVKTYNCPCADVHIIQPKTTPSGVVAYYKNKYPKLTINEFARINKPGIITDPKKFKAGTRVCLLRKPCS